MSETKLQSRILIRSQKKEVSKLDSNKTLERNYNFLLLSSHNLRGQYQYIVSKCSYNWFIASAKFVAAGKCTRSVSLTLI